MSNLPPGFTEPREHDPRCAVLCSYELGADECRHLYHECTCDEWSEWDAEAMAEAWADMDVCGQALSDLSTIWPE